MADFENAVWEGIGGSISASDGVSFTEDFNFGIHAITQDIQYLHDDFGLDTEAVFYARVKPKDRDRVTLSCREDNGVNTVWFLLTGAGTVTSIGSNVLSASIVEVPGEGAYDLTVIWNALPASLLRFSLGATIANDPTQKYQGDGQQPFEILRAQVIPGTTPQPYQETTDRRTIPDLATADGSQDATLDASKANWPNNLNLDYIEGGLEPATITDFSYDSSDFTAYALVEWNGVTGAEQIIFQHAAASNLAIQGVIDTAGRFLVRISTDGATYQKVYRADRFLDTFVKTLILCTWNGTTLRLWYNDIELTGAELVLDTDNAASGSLFDSTANIELMRDAIGSRLYVFRMFDPAQDATAVAGIAAGFGVSGLPSNEAPAPDPTTGDYLPVDDIISIEAESLTTVTDWAVETSVAGFTGSGYLIWNGADNFTTPTAGNANEIQIPFYVPTSGLWAVRLRMNHQSAPADDAENDVWLQCTTDLDGETNPDKWGHPASQWQLGWTFPGFREELDKPPGTFDDLQFNLAAGSHVLRMTGRSNNAKIDRIHIYKLGTDEVDALDETRPESPRSGIGGGGDLPQTRAELESYLTSNFGVSSFFYVNNSTGNDSNPGTLASPWLTIQKAADTLTAGEAVIIQGQGGRFYEAITPGASGNPGQRIWYAGDPEYPAIVDGSQVFGGTFSDQGGNRWRADYTVSLWEWFDPAYTTFCTDSFPECADPIYHLSHYVIHNDEPLRVRQTGTIGVGSPASLDEGECYFEIGSGSRTAPQYIWLRLPGDLNPNSEEIRVPKERYLFDYSPHTWVAGFPGGAESQLPDGRSHIGLLNMHFTVAGTIIKRGLVAFRGTGWYAEWCSFRNAKHHGFTMAGGDHTIINCKAKKNGQGSARYDWFQEIDGGNSLIERLLCEDGNWQDCPPNWEAGNKATRCFNLGYTIFRENLYLRERGPGYWSDIVVGQRNPNPVAVLFDRCIWDSCWRHALFWEHNTEKHRAENCGIWNTQLHSERTISLGCGFRHQGTGHNELVNCAIVGNQGKGIYDKNHDARGNINNNTFTDNVIGRNCNTGNPAADIDIQNVEWLAGLDAYDIENSCAQDSNFNDQLFTSNEYNGNVLFQTNCGDWFAYDQNCNSFVQENNVSTWEALSGSSGNVLETVTNVVADWQDRKEFWKTSAGNYPTKGPQGLTHPEDIPATQWVIPT